MLNSSKLENMKEKEGTILEAENFSFVDIVTSNCVYSIISLISILIEVIHL